MIKEYILFDLDGTLLDSLPLIETTFRHAFEQFDLPWDDGAVMKNVGLPLQDVCRRFAGPRWRELFDCYVNYQAAIHDDYVRLFPGAKNALTEIKPWVWGLGVVTSKRRQLARRGLAMTGLNYHLDYLVALEDTQKPKPHAEPVLHSLRRFQAKPEQAVFVGDSHFDILAGRNAGVVTVGVTWGAVGREELQAAQPDYLVDSWTELLEVLRG